MSAGPVRVHCAPARVLPKYHDAFEAGTMDDIACGFRLVQLRGDIAKLTAPTAKRSATPSTTYRTAPPPGTIDRIRAHLADIITLPAPAERKAMIEAFAAEIRITGSQAIPVFKIPRTRPDSPSRPHSHHQEQPPVRTMASCGPNYPESEPHPDGAGWVG